MTDGSDIGGSADADAVEARLFRMLDALGVSIRTIAHEPTATVAESRERPPNLAGGRTKNLFLTDKKGSFLLISALADTRVDLAHVAAARGLGRLSFASDEALMERLGVRPGSVTPFALIHAGASDVDALFDRRLLEWDRVLFHPLRNDRSTSIRPFDLLRFVERVHGRSPTVLDLSGR